MARHCPMVSRQPVKRAEQRPAISLFITHSYFAHHEGVRALARSSCVCVFLPPAGPPLPCEVEQPHACIVVIMQQGKGSPFSQVASGDSLDCRTGWLPVRPCAVLVAADTCCVALRVRAGSRGGAFRSLPVRVRASVSSAGEGGGANAQLSAGRGEPQRSGSQRCGSLFGVWVWVRVQAGAVRSAHAQQL